MTGWFFPETYWNFSSQCLIDQCDEESAMDIRPRFCHPTKDQSFGFIKQDEASQQKVEFDSKSCAKAREPK